MNLCRRGYEKGRMRILPFFISNEIFRVWFSKALVNRKRFMPIFNLFTVLYATQSSS